MNDDFDFDSWAQLARDNPAEFERRRRAFIEETIDAMPVEHHARLKGLQFRVDLERQRAKTPMGATIRLNSMMMDSFWELRQALQRLTDPDGAQARATQLELPRVPAQVLRFAPRARKAEGEGA